MNKYKKIIVLFFCMLGFPALAEDNIAGSVSERMDCATMQNNISELSAVENPDDDTKNKLNNLKDLYRKNCSKTASGRTTSGRASTFTVAQVASDKKEEDVKSAEDILKQYDKNKEENCNFLKKIYCFFRIR